MTDPLSGKYSKHDTLIAVLLLIVGALAVAIMPNTAKLTINAGANTESTILIRVLTAIPLLGIYMIVKGINFRIPTDLYTPTLVASFSSAGMNYAMYYSIQYIDIGLSMLIMFTHPFWIAYYYHTKNVARLNKVRVFWSVSALMGLSLALAVNFETISFVGIFLAFLASVLTTTMVISMVETSKIAGSISTNFHMASWTLVITIALLTSYGSLKWPETLIGWASGVGNGISYIVAYLAFLGAARLIGASRASMLTFMEPVAAILLAAWIFGESLTLLQWLGVTLVAAGLFFMETSTNIFSRYQKNNQRTRIL